MPTPKQYQDNIAAEFGLFGGFGKPKLQSSEFKVPTELTGEVIGHFEYDEENGDIKIVIDEQDKRKSNHNSE